MTKTYLGDSVYAEYDGWQIKLCTENGYGANNIIYLEPEVYINLEKLILSVRQDQAILPPPEGDK